MKKKTALINGRANACDSLSYFLRFVASKYVWSTEGFENSHQIILNFVEAQITAKSSGENLRSIMGEKCSPYPSPLTVSSVIDYYHSHGCLKYTNTITAERILLEAHIRNYYEAVRLNKMYSDIHIEEDKSIHAYVWMDIKNKTLSDIQDAIIKFSEHTNVTFKGTPTIIDKIVAFGDYCRFPHALIDNCSAESLMNATLITVDNPIENKNIKPRTNSVIQRPDLSNVIVSQKQQIEKTKNIEKHFQDNFSKILPVCEKLFEVKRINKSKISHEKYAIAITLMKFIAGEENCSTERYSQLWDLAHTLGAIHINWNKKVFEAIRTHLSQRGLIFWHNHYYVPANWKRGLKGTACRWELSRHFDKIMKMRRIAPSIRGREIHRIPEIKKFS